MAVPNLYHGNFCNNGEGKKYELRSNAQLNDMIRDGFFECISKDENNDLIVVPKYPGVGLFEKIPYIDPRNSKNKVVAGMFFISSSRLIKNTKANYHGGETTIELFREGNSSPTVVSFLLCNFLDKKTLFTASLGDTDLFRMVLFPNTCVKMAADFENHQIIVSDSGVGINEVSKHSSIPEKFMNFNLGIITCGDYKPLGLITEGALSAGKRFISRSASIMESCVKESCRKEYCVTENTVKESNIYPRGAVKQCQRRRMCDDWFESEADGDDSNVCVGAVSDVEVIGGKYKQTDFDYGKSYLFSLRYLHRYIKTPSVQQNFVKSADGTMIFCPHGVYVIPEKSADLFKLFAQTKCDCSAKELFSY